MHTAACTLPRYGRPTCRREAAHILIHRASPRFPPRGTITRFTVTAGGCIREYRMRVDEPEPGRALTESNTGSSLVTTTTVSPSRCCHLGIRTMASRSCERGGTGAEFLPSLGVQPLRGCFGLHAAPSAACSHRCAGEDGWNHVTGARTGDLLAGGVRCCRDRGGVVPKPIRPLGRSGPFATSRIPWILQRCAFYCNRAHHVHGA
jgi:hypothetical protein